MTETDDIVAYLRPHPRVADDASVLYRARDIRRLFAHITRLEERCAALTGQVDAGAAEIERLTQITEINATGLPYSIGFAEGYESGAQDLHKLQRRAEAAEREVAALKEEVGRLRETLEKADTPNQFWSWEDPESGGPDLDYVMDDCPHDGIEHLLCGRSLPDRWGAFRCLTVDEDGDPEETVIEIFATKEQAERCWPESLAAARAALQPQEPKLNIGGGDE